MRPLIAALSDVFFNVQGQGFLLKGHRIEQVQRVWGIEKKDVFSSFAHEIKRTRPFLMILFGLRFC
jgi:hypothetical protein